MVIDAEATPLLAQVTEKGHRIGAADDDNFEFGLDCILDHAERLIERRQDARQDRRASRPRPRPTQR